MKISSRLKLIVIFIILLLGGFAFVSVYNFRTARNSITAEIVSSSLPLMRENIYSEIQKDFMPSLNIASAMAADSFLKNWIIEGEEEQNKIIQYLEQIHARYGYFSTFFVSDLTGNYYHYEGILKQVNEQDGHDVWFYRFKNSGADYVLDVDTNEAAQNKLTIFINYRVEDFDGNFIGVTGVGIEMSNFSSFLRQQQEKYNRHIYLVDDEGIIQAHSEQELITGKLFQLRPGINKIADEILYKNAEPTDSKYEGENGTVFVTSKYVPEMDWFIIVEQYQKEALASIRKNLLRTVLIGGLVSVLVILIIILVVNYYQKRLELLAVTDELTGLVNRREFDTQLQKSIYRNSRYGVPFSIVVIDIDLFKNINDTQGHLRGDEILKGVSESFLANVRPDDCVARVGGDEFIILLECDGTEAYGFAERINEDLKKKFPAKESGPPVTLSMGIAEYRTGETSTEVIRRADKALYQSKEGGRDTITTAE